MKKLIVVLIIVAVITAGYFYIFQPHITFQEVRVSNQPEEVKAVFVNVTGDPLCAKLYKLERMDNDKPVASSEPLFLALPDGMASPEEGKLAYTDNIFMLKGYSYRFEEHNKLTQSAKTSTSHRFDVVAWKVVPPYKQWKNGSPGGDAMVEAETVTAPVSYQMSTTDDRPAQFLKGNYVDCLR